MTGQDTKLISNLSIIINTLFLMNWDIKIIVIILAQCSVF